MIIENHYQRIKDGLSVALLCAAAVLLVLLFNRLIAMGTETYQSADLAEINSGAKPGNTNGETSPSHELAKALKEKNMFLPPRRRLSRLGKLAAFSETRL